MLAESISNGTLLTALIILGIICAIIFIVRR